jgi:hypothetical protein
MDSVAVGSPLSPVITKFYVEDFEEWALDLAPTSLSADFASWMTPPSFGDAELIMKGFLNHLNSIHEFIQSTMETESEGQLPFLDIDIYRRPDGSLGHRVYRKATHTNLYLNAGSHHHPSSKQATLSTLVLRDRALYNQERNCMRSWCS